MDKIAFKANPTNGQKIPNMRKNHIYYSQIWERERTNPADG